MTESQATAPAKAPQPEPDYPDIKFQFLEEEKPLEEPKQSSLFTRLLRKHQRLMTLIGGMIVFFTFITKEGIREHLKDFSDTIQKGQQLIQSKPLTLGIPPQLVEAEKITNDLLQSADAARKAGKHPEVSDDDPFKFGTAYDLLRDYREGVNAQFRLVNKMANYLNASPNFLAGTKHALDVENFDMDKFTKISTIGPIDMGSDVYHDFLLQFHILISAAYFNGQDVRSVTVTALAQSEKKLTEVDHSYNIATRASYFLYTLGWGLGLAGRLVGVNTGSED